MKDEQIKDIVINAIGMESLIPLFLGEQGLKVSDAYMSPSSEPTNYSKILSRGFYDLYRDGKLDVEKKLEEGILDLLDSSKGFYICFSILLSQLQFEKQKISPFILEKNKIINKITSQVNLYKNELKEDFTWGSSKETEGLWSEVLRLNNIIYKKYNLILLDLD